MLLLLSTTQGLLGEHRQEGARLLAQSSFPYALHTAMSLVSVNLAAASVEAALFGIFFSLAVSSICLLVNRRLKEVNTRAMNPVNWVTAVQGVWRSTLFVATIAFILIITAVSSRV